MKKVLVITPPKFGLTDEELEAFRNRYYELVYEVQKQLDEFCVRAIRHKDYSFLKKDTLENKKKCFTTYVDMLLNFEVDCALFADGWESSEECKKLHSIAEMFNVSVLHA